jgi:hypothetical protein
VVARVNGKLDDFDYQAKPRLWIELKERGTWWGAGNADAAKAFGTANHGIWSDLEKWESVTDKGESVLVCQVTMHDGSYNERMPASWRAQFDQIAQKYEHAIERCVGYEIAGEDKVRWARFDACIVNRG